MASILEQLKGMTVVVADTGDINSIRKFKPRDAITNPSLITAAAQMPEYQDVVDEALRWGEKQAGSASKRKEIVTFALDRLAVEFGLRILEIVPKRVSTEVDARLSFDTKATIEKARYLMKQYEEKLPDARERVLIKIAATWEGIKAAEILEKEGIHCNLTLIFGEHQAIACAEAGVRLISPFVGRILDYYKKQDPNGDFAGAKDPGCVSVTRIYNYYKKYDHKTEIMGASFRTSDEIVELAGCDLLTIAPKLLDELNARQGTLVQKLDASKSKAMTIEKVSYDEAKFREAHKNHAMSLEKLQEGIDGFSKAIVALEALLTARLATLQTNARDTVATSFFSVYDLDGDGVISREEWAGSHAVFDALDLNGDGAITPQELAAGLGAAHHLQAKSA
jgi:transaldolase